MQYRVTGMTCAACSARVEKAVSKVDGVTACSVSLLTNSMSVEGTASPESIVRAVSEAGYGATPENKPSADESALENTETKSLVIRLCVSAFFLLVLMWFSMGYTMWDFPVPTFLNDRPLTIGWIQFLLAAIVLCINQRFFVSGTKAVLHRAPNMDTLVALGSAASFLYSTAILIDMTAIHSGFGLHDLYFETSAMIPTLITVGKTLESRAKGKTTDALRSLMKLSPKTATVIRDGAETVIPVDEIRIGDLFIVKAGEQIPADGIVKEGQSAINESALTGESLPADKAEGDPVYTGTLNTSGYLKCEATRVGENTTLSQIIKMISDAAATKAPIAKIADRVSGIFVPTVIAIALITTLVWLLIGQTFGYALARGISVLVISCPCALGLATPVAIMVGSGLGAKNGILFKNAISLEHCGKTDIVVLDKTGTVTKGTPHVTDIVPANPITETQLLTLAYALESKSEHPLAGAIVAEAENRSLKLLPVTDFETLPGNGLKAVCGGKTLHGGNQSYISGLCEISREIEEQAEKFAESGKTPLYFSYDGRLLGIIAVSDVIKEDSPKAVRELQAMGIRVVMLTGDRKSTADAIGKQVGADKVIAEVLPDGKESVVCALKESGAIVTMVGDGINDAPALTSADIGMAIGAGTDVAIDSAQIILMNGGLTEVCAAIRISRATLRNIKQNLFWAFFYNAIGIPIAAGVFSSLGLTLNPMIGAAAMSLSSFCVVTNALRLNFCKPFDAGNDRKKPMANLPEIKETQMLKYTIKIQGMMCEHCEAHIKKALSALPGVREVKADHMKGEAYVQAAKALPEADAQKAIADAGYEFISIRED